MPPTSPDDRPIESRIADALDQLTESELRLAQVVRQTQGNLASFTAHELAARADVSQATAARFFQRLGYATYAAARRQSRDQHPWASPAAGLAGHAARPGTERGFAAYAAHDGRNLAHTAEAMPDATVQQAVGILSQAAAVHVVGFRNSMVLASYARALLAQVRPSVLLLPHVGLTVAEELAGFKAGDALLAIGFRRRPPVLQQVVAVAKQAGLSIVLLADDSVIAAARDATVTLTCRTTGFGMFDSYAVAISLIAYLGDAVGLAAGQGAADRLRRIEALHTQLGSFGAEQEPRRRLRKQSRSGLQAHQLHVRVPPSAGSDPDRT